MNKNIWEMNENIKDEPIIDAIQPTIQTERQPEPPV